jgi:uncharacterized protein YbdZ (MbtH family)
MVTTLGPPGHEGGRRLTPPRSPRSPRARCSGGVVTFAGLAALGSVLGGGTLALAVAAVVAAAGALLELAGVPIAPQVRRQVPEHWRRYCRSRSPRGCTASCSARFTDVRPDLRVPVLAAIALAVGDVGAGLAMGLAFGAGRLLPIVLLAPLADRPAGWRATELMAERRCCCAGSGSPTRSPRRRRADARRAERLRQVPGLVSRLGHRPERGGGRGRVARPGGRDRGARRPGRTRGDHVALGGRHVAPSRRAASSCACGDRRRRPRPARPGGTDALAVSARWLVLRTRGATRGADRDPPGRRARPDGPHGAVGRARAPGPRPRPRVVHLASQARSAIEQGDLGTGRRRALRTPAGRLSQPAVLGSRCSTWRRRPRQHLRLGRRRERPAGRDRSLLRLAPSIAPTAASSRAATPTARRARTRPAPAEGPVTTLWTTALAADAAYVTRLVARPGGGVTSELVRVAR